MRSPKLIGLIAAASVLAACSGQNSSVMTHPGSGPVNHSIVHALVAPGHMGQLAIMPGAPRANSGVHHDFAATAPCTYLTDNFSANVNVYNSNRTLAGTIGPGYGWGAYAVKTLTLSSVFLGRNDGSGSIDMYSPCTGNFTGSVTGEGLGGAAYGIAGFRGAGKKGYATDWPVGDIEYITASGPYAELHANGRAHVIRERMQMLEERLDPAKFFRIHRSAIVRLDQIETLLRDPGGDYGVKLRSGVQLSVSRNRVEQLERWMGLAT